MKLFEHQQAALDDFLSRDGKMILNAPVGSGKTAVAMRAADALRETTIYFAPKILAEQIFSEALTWCRSLVPVVVEGEKKVRQAIWQAQGGLVDGKSAPMLFIANKELMLHDFEAIRDLAPGFIIVDELHQWNGWTAKRYRALRKLSAKHRLAMSGTPWPNGPWEVFNMVAWVAEPRVIWKNAYEFKQRECRLNPWNGVAGVYDEAKLLKIANACSHVVPRSVVKLPELVVKDIPVHFERPQLVAYNLMRDELRLKVKDGEVTAVNALSMLMRLRQIASEPDILGLDCGSAKSDALKEVLETSTAKKVIIFSEFAVALRILAKRFGGYLITGAESQEERGRIIEAWKKDKERLLFLSPAGENGLNLQVADAVISYDLPWNAAHEEQRVGRAWRTGRTEPVVHWRLIAQGSVDEKMAKLIERKRTLGAKITGDDLIGVLMEKTLLEDLTKL